MNVSCFFTQTLKLVKWSISLEFCATLKSPLLASRNGHDETVQTNLWIQHFHCSQIFVLTFEDSSGSSQALFFYWWQFPKDLISIFLNRNDFWIFDRDMKVYTCLSKSLGLFTYLIKTYVFLSNVVLYVHSIYFWVHP